MPRLKSPASPRHTRRSAAATESSAGGDDRRGGATTGHGRSACVTASGQGRQRILCAVNEVGNRHRFATVIINGPKVREPKPADYDDNGSGSYLPIYYMRSVLSQHRDLGYVTCVVWVYDV